jgi:glycosyltransferase involved in cell wall biosynthesis
MRILYVVHQFYPEFSSGTERVVLNLASSMQRSGHHADIVTYSFAERSEFRPSGSVLAKQYQYKGISVTAVRHDNVRVDINTSLEDSSILSFAREMLGGERGSYDLVHIVHPMRLTSFAISALETGVPYVLTLTDFWMVCPKVNLRTSFNTQCNGPEGGVICSQWCPELRPEFIRSRLKTAHRILHGAKAIVVPSRLVDAIVKKEFPDLTSSIIPHGLPLDEFRTNPRVPKKGAKTVFGYCGGLSAHKGVDVLIKAFRSLEHPNIQLHIYGTSSRHEPEFEKMLRKAAGEDDRIKFCGRYQEEDAAQVFHTIDALIIPSLCYESYSFTLHEALASRVPVIASAVACLDEKIQDSVTGLTFRVGDADDLVDKLRSLLSNPGMLDKMKQNIRSFSVPRVEEEAYLYERIYKTARRGLPEPIRDQMVGIELDHL